MVQVQRPFRLCLGLIDILEEDRGTDLEEATRPSMNGGVPPPPLSSASYTLTQGRRTGPRYARATEGRKARSGNSVSSLLERALSWEGVALRAAKVTVAC